MLQRRCKVPRSRPWISTSSSAMSLTPRNLQKLKQLARALDATVLRPYYPVSDLYRVVRDDDGLQIDFLGTIHGLRSLAGVRHGGP